ncbi:uncharacterized protein LOC129903920 isoform X1 [Solanum dulcamara]|uniref:uncharacterized protein LOC129903920 isoform X1 n=1 Tax=Solanum dulcamara TaxID=45834 RepID=UPI0024864B04|nr:uncharacterized protein LOC129903920 isoform X1 [Solanum dulcamara]
MGRNQSEASHQQIHQQVKKEGPSTTSNATEISSTIIENVASRQSSSSFVTKQAVHQLKQTRLPQEQLKSYTFILEEFGEHSREGTRSLIIQKMEKQYVLLSRLQEALSQNSKRVRSDPRAQKKFVP